MAPQPLLDFLYTLPPFIANAPQVIGDAQNSEPEGQGLAGDLAFFGAGVAVIALKNY
jgi:hypothetical protein